MPSAAIRMSRRGFARLISAAALTLLLIPAMNVGGTSDAHAEEAAAKDASYALYVSGIT